MKILHTSDWHLGQFFMGKSRKHEHQALINWLFNTIETQEIDAVIIAGDVFDTGAPPSYARELYSQLILGIYQRGCQLIVVAGNHDSVSMLNEAKPLLTHLSTHVVTHATPQTPESHVIKLFEKGRSYVAALVCAIPYIRPRDIVMSEAGQDEKEKQDQLAQAIKQFYHNVYQAALAESEALGGVPIIGTGHLTTLGASVSESVRDIYVGSLTAFPTDYFPHFSYLALGHIHRPQKVAGLSHIRYSGSPIALSFDEVATEKSMTLVSFDSNPSQAQSLSQSPQPALSIDTLAVPCFQPLLSLTGEMEDIIQSIQDVITSSSKVTSQVPLWLEVTLISDDFVSDLFRQLQQGVEGLDVVLLRVKRQLKTQAQSMKKNQNVSLTELSVGQVFERCMQSAGVENEQLTQLFHRHYQDMLEAQQELDNENP